MSVHTVPPLTLIPENAPFTLEQRSWLVRRHAGMAARRPPDRDEEIRAAVATYARHPQQFLR